MDYFNLIHASQRLRGSRDGSCRCGLFKRRVVSRFPICPSVDYGGFRIISADPEDPSAGKQNKAWPVCALQPAIMDFNVKKLASDAGVFFTRAVQVKRLAWLPASVGPDVPLLH